MLKQIFIFILIMLITACGEDSENNFSDSPSVIPNVNETDTPDTPNISEYPSLETEISNVQKKTEVHKFPSGTWSERCYNYYNYTKGVDSNDIRTSIKVDTLTNKYIQEVVIYSSTNSTCINELMRMYTYNRFSSIIWDSELSLYKMDVRYINTTLKLTNFSIDTSILNSNRYYGRSDWSILLEIDISNRDPSGTFVYHPSFSYDVFSLSSDETILQQNSGKSAYPTSVDSHYSFYSGRIY